MTFDNHLMQPLFQLMIGKPGSSFAFEIARKIGLPEEILSEASRKAGFVPILLNKLSVKYLHRICLGVGR